MRGTQNDVYFFVFFRGILVRKSFFADNNKTNLFGDFFGPQKSGLVFFEARTEIRLADLFWLERVDKKHPGRSGQYGVQGGRGDKNGLSCCWRCRCPVGATRCRFCRCCWCDSIGVVGVAVGFVGVRLGGIN